MAAIKGRKPPKMLYSSDHAKELIRDAVEAVMSLTTVIAGAIEPGPLHKILIKDSRLLWAETWGRDDYNPEVVRELLSELTTQIGQTNVWQAPLKGLRQLVDQDQEASRE